MVGQEDILIRCQKQDHRIGGWLLNGLQQRILCLDRHFLCFIHNIDLVIAAVGPYHNSIIDLLPDIIHANAGRLLMGHMDQVRMVPRQHLPAGMTLHTGICGALLTKKA